ncbi:MAG: YbjN domain-containing protein [Bacteroidales bacterium]|nr:YbjN domain-containing protein [Bacteroidales bacterium]MDD6622246.1 YbjN domain-containing protein [Bacteroidales bacterium]MDD6670021.1 YbjN domain-containing protein [Bacteroidales bacterium]
MIDNNKLSNALRAVCSEVVPMAPFGWMADYKGRQYMLSRRPEIDFLRVSLPYLEVGECGADELLRVVNYANRGVKFVKAMVLNSGNVSLCYDCRVDAGSDYTKLLSHILSALDYTCRYVEHRLKFHQAIMC